MTNKFKFFKLNINLLDPSGFLTKKYDEINCSLHSVHFSIAFFSNNLLISILSVFSSFVDQSGSGGIICLGVSWKGILYSLKHWIMNGSDVISLQLRMKCFKRPAIAVTSVTSSTTSGSMTDLMLLKQFLTLSDCIWWLSV